MGIVDVAKRALVGRKLRSTQLDETLLPKRIAFPVFASDELSTVTYSPDQIFLTLSLGGMAAYTFSWQIGLAVALALVVVVASYRQNVHAYPHGGGDYEVTTNNLGRNAGVTVGSALLVDYVLTVAVSVSSAVQNASSALPWLEGNEATAATLLVLLLMAMNLRGTSESGTAFAVPSYLFMGAILLMAGWGYVAHLAGTLPTVQSADLELVPSAEYEGALSGLAMALLLLRAFSSGCVALTGIESVSNGVPAFRKPKSRNAASTLVVLAVLSVTMLASVVVLAGLMGLRYADDPARQLLQDGRPVGPGYEQATVIGQVAKALYADVPPLFYFTIACAGLILLLAANTSFNSFPVLGSILARDGYLPRQLDTRGDRLTFSNGIILLAIGAIAMIQVFDAEVTQLIHLYIVCVFVSFTMSQAGMVRHWNRRLRDEDDPANRGRLMRARVISAVGMSLTGLVVSTVLITEFLGGAWIAVLTMAMIFLGMKGIGRHYEQVASELEIDEEDLALPSRVHAIVLVGKVHKPTMRAIAYARASRPNTLEALSVEFESGDSVALRERWDELGIPVPLKVISSPYRELVRTVVRYVKEIRKSSPRDVVTVYIPEYVVGRWWEQLLHNQTALRLKGRLLFMPGVMVTSVPFQLRSAGSAKLRSERPAPGDVRRGVRGPSERR